MIYDDLNYTHEADIFANQQKFVKGLSPYEVFKANVEAGNDEQLIILGLVNSYGLDISPNKKDGVICAVATLESIFEKYGYHVLDRTLRLCVGTWEGEQNSLSVWILNAIAKLIVVYGDTLNDAVFKQRVGALSIKQLGRTAKERGGGTMGYAETMIMEYNGKKKNSENRLRMHKLYSKGSAELMSSGAIDITKATGEGITNLFDDSTNGNSDIGADEYLESQ